MHFSEDMRFISISMFNWQIEKTKVCFPMMYILPLMNYLVALPPVSNANYSIAMNVKYVKYLKLVDIIVSCLFYHGPWL